MNTQRFTIKSQELLADMQDLASGYGHQEIKDLHLLQAMLAQEEGLIQPALEKLDPKPQQRLLQQIGSRVYLLVNILMEYI